ncbi:hypothetical protein K491DRAFT_745927 [Lophiostoma macrostomum CBS 122681]|uniref:JmjC domain-containing protein n=1 Tax=Lophiostoma macrostomum CBS 122681 TaxID=1314788 RepID=A0A6A6TAN6_9PLEO|nr:hypothetical protein K491DRAFT_745927 [Lophiostoma macrostomum CBS 122681]
MARTLKNNIGPVPEDVKHTIQSIVTAGRIQELDVAKRSAFKDEYSCTPSIEERARFPKEKDLVRVLKHTLRSHIYGLNPIIMDPAEHPDWKNRAPAMNLIDRLDDPSYRGNGESLRLQCSEFDYLLSGKIFAEPGLLQERGSQISITPCAWSTSTYGGISQEWLQSCLLTGLKMWLVFPPHTYNLATYQRACAFADINEYKDAGEDFRGAVRILQRPGQTVYVPAFWPRISFTLRTACSVDFRYRLVQDVPLHLRSVDTIHARLELLGTEERRQDLGKWAHEMVENVCSILQDDIEMCTTSSEQLVFRNEWSALQRDINLWMAGSSDSVWRHNALSAITRAWSWHSWDEAPYECQICDEVLEIDNGKPAFERAFEEHFRTFHWPALDTASATPVPAPDIGDFEEDKEAEDYGNLSGVEMVDMPELSDSFLRTPDEDEDEYADGDADDDADGNPVDIEDDSPGNNNEDPLVPEDESTSDESSEQDLVSDPDTPVRAEIPKPTLRMKQKGWTGWASISADVPDTIASRKKEIDPELNPSHILPETMNRRSRPAINFAESSSEDEVYPKKAPRRRDVKAATGKRKRHDIAEDVDDSPLSDPPDGLLSSTSSGSSMESDGNRRRKRQHMSKARSRRYRN